MKVFYFQLKVSGEFLLKCEALCILMYCTLRYGECVYESMFVVPYDFDCRTLHRFGALSYCIPYRYVIEIKLFCVNLNQLYLSPNLDLLVEIIFL